MASQRHKLVEQGTTAAGEVHAEGEVARSVIHQVVPDPSALNVLTAPKDLPPDTELEVPFGPTGGPLQGSSMSGAIPVEYEPQPEPEPPEPLPGEEPVLNSINPSSARVGDDDVVMNVNGNNFTETSLIYFNGGAEATTFVNQGQLSTIVKPSTATVVGGFPVWVQQGSYKTDEKTFTFTEPALEAGGRTLPLGPFTISLIEDHADGLALTVDGSPDIRVGDMATIEATGNTSVNGSYDVVLVDGDKVVVENTYELAAPIEAKGRVTVS